MNGVLRRLVRPVSMMAMAALALPVMGVANVASASTVRPAADNARGGAGRAIAAYKPGASTGASTPSAGRSSTSSGVAPKALSAGPSTATTYCSTGLVYATPLADRVVVPAQVDGASSITLERQHELGAWRVVATKSGSSVVFNDLSTNPLGWGSYRVTARNADGSVRSRCDLYGIIGRSSEDGWGTPDFVVAAQGPVTQQVPGSGTSVPWRSGTWLTPAYSADGRLVAATRIDATSGAGILEVRLARTAALQFSVDLGADVSVADPAFSPNGQTLAFSGYDTATGDPLGIGFVSLVGSHAPSLLDTDVPVVEPAWLPDSSAVVVTAFDAAGGLSTVCPTCPHPTPLSGTAGGYTAEVATDGTVYFTVDDGTTSALKMRTPAGSVKTIRSSTSDVYSQPRVAPDRTLYVGRVARATDPSISERHYIVAVSPTGPSADEEMDTPEAGDVLMGFDVRQPKSKGSSDYVGDANPEILGKDASGRLWAYFSSDTKPVAGRVSMGGGWNMFNQVVAAGDLDGDDKADILGRKPDGTLWMYHGLGAGKVRSAVQVGSGWTHYVLVAPGDFNGDGHADLLGRDSAYRLWLYPGKGDGHFGARSLVTSGWGGFSAIIGFGDFNFDGTADILGRERSTGYLYLYPGTGTGTITGRTRLGAGWNTLNAFAAPEFAGTTPGLFGRRADGTMLYYEVFGDGRFDSNRVYGAGAGWSSFQITG